MLYKGKLQNISIMVITSQDTNFVTGNQRGELLFALRLPQSPQTTLAFFSEILRKDCGSRTRLWKISCTEMGGSSYQI
jgi:hypothetical protein